MISWQKTALLLVLFTSALAVLVASGSAQARSGPTYTTFCPPHASQTGWENKIPSGIADPENYASCDDCRPLASHAKCELWWGGQTSDGGEGGVSHKGWPGLTGIRWQVVQDRSKGATSQGTIFNDGLYGRHGSDKLYGKEGDDVLWGDSKISPLNDGRQKDVLDGGPGNDWIYASHGKNTITAGDGNDRVFAYYGRGTIDCGPGVDRLVIRKKSPYKVKHCEKITHPKGAR